VKKELAELSLDPFVTIIFSLFIQL